MATQWSYIYTQVCDVLLEGNPGLTLNLLTDQEFYTIAAEVLIDLCGKAGLIKKLFNVELNYGVQKYKQYDTCGEIQGCMASQSFIYESSDFYLSNSNREWQSFSNIGNPESYRQDSISTKSIQITPAPQFNGNDVVVAGGQPGWGVIGAVQTFSDFTITADVLTPVGFGTASGANGNPYLECLNPGYGVFGVMVPSTNNLMMQGTTLPFQVENLSGSTYVELLPDSIAQVYLQYGILAKVFSGNSELRDEQKAAYAKARYSEGISLLSAIVCDVYQEDAQ